MLKVLKICLLSLVVATLATSCKSDENPAKGNQEELLFFNGSIYTVNPAQEWAEAMLVKDGKIVAIGSEATVSARATDKVRRINLRQKMVMPGIHDVHMHPLEASSDNFLFTIDNETDISGYTSAVESAIKANKNVDWILGWGFDLETLLASSKSPISLLDEISTTKPIAIMELTSHAMWVNSKALELVNMNKQSPDPQGGIIMKDASGEPNGILIDNAGNIVVDLAINSISDNEQNDYDGLVNYGLPMLAKNGITSVCDARTYWKRNHHSTWQRIANEGNLTVRVNLGLWIYPNETDDDQIETIKGLYSNDSNALLRINQIKVYMDGIVTNTTSAMHKDFNIDLFNKTTNNGLNYIAPKRLENLISALEPVGYDFHIHAIGDRGVHEALSAIELGSFGYGRHRLTHVEYIATEDLSRFKSLNVVADAQVSGDFTQPEHWHHNDKYVSSELNNNIIPIKSLLESGATLTLSSDWDVSDLNPFVGMQNAVTRKPQNISLAEAIRAYTINGAYVMRQENRVGSLEIGKEADFVILNQNLFDVTNEGIEHTKVLETYVRGVRVY